MVGLCGVPVHNCGKWCLRCADALVLCRSPFACERVWCCSSNTYIHTYPSPAATRQALPLHGYTRIFENMLLDDSNIKLRLGVDFFSAKEAVRGLIL